MDADRAAKIKIGVDPLGGAAVHYWEPIAERYRPRTSQSSIRRSIRRFAFMTVDHDGKIRMDCSSPYAMAGLVAPEGSLPRRLRQRSGRRPARHRDAVSRVC